MGREMLRQKKRKSYSSDTCLSGNIINRMNDFYRDHHDKYGIAIIAKNFTKDDLFNMRNNLKIYFELDLPTNILSEKMDKIVSEFNESLLNNIVMFTDSRGKILNLFYNSCDCWGLFSSYIVNFPTISEKAISK